MTELDFIMKYAPSFGVLVAVVLLIAYTKKNLFTGVISKDLFDTQLQREREFVGVMKENAGHLDEISRQMESTGRKQADDVHAQTEAIRALLNEVSERLHTLELVFSDHIDAIRQLAAQCEKHRKNIPETQDMRQPRK
jgi:DNA-binding FrmR family transcriptional regulator